MKRKQIIWKEISQTDLMISNLGYVHNRLGYGVPLKIDLESDWVKYFTTEEMELIDDDEEQLPEIISNQSISFDEFMKR